MTLKRARFGIKMFSLRETTGYLWESCVYLGKVPNAATNIEMVSTLGKGDAVVPRLMEGLPRKASINTNSVWTIGTLLRSFFLLSFLRMR